MSVTTIASQSNGCRDPFDHSDWIFELKYDGFRSLAKLQHGRCELVSRDQYAFKSFATLAADIGLVLSSEWDLYCQVPRTRQPTLGSH
jgi:hypothetical protein